MIQLQFVMRATHLLLTNFCLMFYFSLSFRRIFNWTETSGMCLKCDNLWKERCKGEKKTVWKSDSLLQSFYLLDQFPVKYLLIDLIFDNWFLSTLVQCSNLWSFEVCISEHYFFNETIWTGLSETYFYKVGSVWSHDFLNVNPCIVH